MRILLPVKTGLLVAMAMLVSSCGLLGPNAGGTARPVPVPEVVAQNKGKVIVVLLGMEGCPGTEAATSFLTRYSKSKPEGVAVYRIDVPLRGKSLGPASNLDPALNYLVDGRRTAAAWFEFFFYPTLYIVNKDGVVRFAGGCEPEKVKAMVSEILCEKPDSEKKMYTPPLARVGSNIPDFKIMDLDGKETSLGSVCKDKGALLIFSSTTCPFSVNALDDFEKLKKRYGRKTGFAIVAFGENAATVKSVYSEKSPGSTVLIDADKSLSTKYFSVSAVPFFYVLDKGRNVVERRPFVYDSARAGISMLLGGKAAGGSRGCGDAGAG